MSSTSSYRKLLLNSDISLVSTPGMMITGGTNKKFTIETANLCIGSYAVKVSNGPGLDITYALTYGIDMSTLTASEARAKLYRLIDEAAESHIPIRITGKRNNAILISEKDWTSVQETMFLLSIPGMRESIREGMETPVDECTKEPEW